MNRLLLLIHVLHGLSIVDRLPRLLLLLGRLLLGKLLLRWVLHQRCKIRRGVRGAMLRLICLLLLRRLRGRSCGRSGGGAISSSLPLSTR
jgi:hypothetical protein